MSMIRILYFSQNQAAPLGGSMIRALSSILSASNRNNKAAGLSGALIFDEMWFLQALEGERDAVWRTVDRIKEDDRHDKIVIAEVVEVEQRTFGNWWMGLATRNETNEHVFQPFLHERRFTPQHMTASQMLRLMVHLSALGLSRKLASTQAA